MRQLLIVGFLAFPIPVFAQQPSPTIEQITEQAQATVNALEIQRNSALNEAVSLRVQLSKLTKELEALKAKSPLEKPAQ